MILKEIFIDNFRGIHEPTSFAFQNGVNLIVGDNGSGKSTLLNAVEWVLYAGEVAKAESGIPERKGWEIAHRDGAKRRTKVRMVFEAKEGIEISITRRKDPADGKRSHGSLELETSPEGKKLEGAEAEYRLEELGIPSLQEWFRSYCQHQEDVRGRVLDKSTRGAMLTDMVGGAGFIDFGVHLREILKPGSWSLLASTKDEALKTAEASRPSPRALQDAKDSLTAVGVDPDSVSQTFYVQEVDATLVNARAWAKKMECEDDVPGSFSSSEETLQWLNTDWKAKAAEFGGPLAQKPALEACCSAIGSSLPAFQEADRALAAANQDQATFEKENGDREALDKGLAEATCQLAKLKEDKESLDQRRALLERAHDTMHEGSSSCPVCDSSVDGLFESLAEQIEAMTSEQTEAAEKAAREKRKEIKALEGKIQELKSLASGLEEATRHRFKNRNF